MSRFRALYVASDPGDALLILKEQQIPYRNHRAPALDSETGGAPDRFHV
jgi:hypothetical protein